MSDDLSPDDRRTPPADASTPDVTGTAPDEGNTPVHERWWWTGAFRAVLGGVVVAYQWPVLSSGEAIVWNWVLAGVGAAIVVWGAWLLLEAYRSRT